ncbi:MAG: MepB family protein [Crocinitomicaceae bacterium]|nr:MepB family protein [Crocinitomicaceae bacterium]
MHENLIQIKAEIFDACGFQFSDFQIEEESREYDACQFRINGLHVISRTAKITPKKAGQFVTFWKRNKQGPIEPFHFADDIDFFVVNVRFENRFGQFVFPKSILVQKGIISIEKKEGKRAFRVYPIWDVVESKQALQSQKWQTNYFFELDASPDLEKIKGAYQTK